MGDAGDERLAVGAELHVPLGLAAVDHLAVEERALEVGSDEVDAAYAAAVAGGEGEEGASRGVAQGRREGLVVVDAGLERRALDAEPCLGRAVTLDLVHPNQLVDAAAAGHLAARDEHP
jgi:hypothetical protein